MAVAVPALAILRPDWEAEPSLISRFPACVKHRPLRAFPPEREKGTAFPPSPLLPRVFDV